LECLLPVWGAAESSKAVEGDHRVASQGQGGTRVWEVWPWPEGIGAQACWMPISGGRGQWSTIEVPQRSRVSETSSTHHPQARARWHSRPQSSICKYPPSLPFFFCKDLFLSSHIGLFGIPFAMRIASQRCVKWHLVRNGTMLFVSQTASQDTICESLCFAKEFVDLNKSQIASQVKICEGLRFANMHFF
jgi:hypothetical protein